MAGAGRFAFGETEKVMFRLEIRRIKSRRVVLLLLACAFLLAFVTAMPAWAGKYDSDGDGAGCRREGRQCRSEARHDNRSCLKACTEASAEAGVEDDYECPRECRQANRSASRQCSLEKLECRTENRDDLDPECADACLGEMTACAEEGGECADACPEISRDAMAACFQGPRDEVRACLQEARAPRASCVNSCREEAACWQEFKGCASECVVVEDGDEGGASE
jgi:hypothetical protein